MAEPHSPVSKTASTATPSRPQLTSSMRSSSYLSDHQQYRPPKQPDNHFGIDAVVEDLTLSSSSPPQNFLPFNGIPSKENPPKVVDSGLEHSFSHPNCASPPGQSTQRLVATLFYKRNGHLHGHASPPGSALSKASSPVPLAQSESNGSNAELSLPANLAPTTNIDSFPLEPPLGTEPEQLDRLYGSYISPFCITSFLHLMSSFPLPQDAPEPYSSHRCLDNQDHPNVVEITLSPAPSPDYLSLDDLRKHELIYRFEREWNVDVVLQRDTLWRRHPRLVVFDMDSTLITQEVIDLLAANVADPPDLAARIADITHRAMAGELEFDGAFRERLQLLRGVSASCLTDLRAVLDVTPGVRELLRALRRLGVKTAVVSGGFQPLTSWLAGELGIDFAHANVVGVDAEGKLNGEVEGRVLGKERKKELLLEIAARERIDLKQTIAVGDGANDLLMIATAGLGIAWRAKPRVQMEAGARLNGESMLDMLYLFGFTREEIEQLAAE